MAGSKASVATAKPQNIKLAKNPPSADEGARRWKEVPEGFEGGFGGQ